MKCTKCKNSILQKAEDGSAKLRLTGPITFSSDGIASSSCFWCKEPVTVPLELKIALPTKERFILPSKK